MTVAGIAEMAGTGRSAVSNWRKRHDDFPRPVTGDGASPEFDLTEIEAWLTKHGRKRYRRQTGTILWNVLDSHRGALSIDRLVDIALSLITWNHMAAATRGDNPAKEVLTEGPDRTLDVLLERVQELPVDTVHGVGLITPIRDAEPRLLLDLLHVIAAAPITGEQATDVHQELLEQYRKSTGHRGDEWATSEVLTGIILACARPRRGDVIYDGAVGRAGFLRGAAQRAADLHSVHGQEINQQTWRWAAQWLLLAGLPGEIVLGDTVKEDLAENVQADLVLSDPPYGLRLRGDDYIQHDKRWMYGLPGRALDLVWLQNSIAHLAPDGRAFVLLPAGSTFRGGAEGRLRAELLRAGTVEAVIALPPGLAGRTGVPLTLWVMTRPGQTVDPSRVLLMNVGRDEVRPAEIAASYHRWRDQVEVPDAGPDATAVAVLDLLGPDATLVPAKWLEPTGFDADPGETVSGLSRQMQQVNDSLARLAMSQPLEGTKFCPREVQIRRTPISDLVAQKIAAIRRGRPKPDDSDLGEDGPLLVSAVDVRHPGNLRISRLAEPVADTDLLTEPGDVLIVAEGSIAAIVDETGGRFPISPVYALRVAADWLDPHYVAAVLSSDTNARFLAGTAIQRARPQDLEVALIPVAEQVRLVAYLRQVGELRRKAVELSESASQLERAAVDATLAGALDLASVSTEPFVGDDTVQTKADVLTTLNYPGPGEQ